MNTSACNATTLLGETRAWWCGIGWIIWRRTRSVFLRRAQTLEGRLCWLTRSIWRCGAWTSALTTNV